MLEQEGTELTERSRKLPLRFLCYLMFNLPFFLVPLCLCGKKLPSLAFRRLAERRESDRQICVQIFPAGSKYECGRA